MQITIQKLLIVIQQQPGKIYLEMAIGANPAGSSANGNYYNGRVYSVRIYNRALTDAEIRENYKVDNSNYKIN